MAQTLLVLLWAIARLPAAGGNPPTIEGVVRSTDGEPVAGVQLCAGPRHCIESGRDGSFRDSSVHWNATGAIYLRKPGFASALLTPDRPWSDLELTLAAGSTEQTVVRPCSAQPPPGLRYVGVSLRVLVPEQLDVSPVKGHDYYGFDVRMEGPEGSPRMRFVWGANAAAWPSRRWLAEHSDIALREILFARSPADEPRAWRAESPIDFRTLDIRGVTAGGRRSRSIVAPGEYIEYSEVASAVADSFDAYLATLCADF